MTPLPPAVRALLVCPRCRGPLRDAADAEAHGLACDACGLVYPIEGGIPVLLAERGIPLASR
ncbi:MAG: hypothetical protein KF689_06995 [Gemmatimonadaceae bacterium]|nr:hypothetical protein [Gemmatimonadaceae bacterium]MCW5825078.1 hypothetical protein [Gemmatimonadaceae bacterium]